MNKFAASLMLGLGMGLLSGCMHEEEEEKKDPVISQNTTLDPNLHGKWLSNTCDLDMGLYYKTELNITPSNFTQTLHSYSDSNCTTMAPGMSMKVDTGTLKIGNKVTTPAGIVATEMDFNFAADGLILASTTLQIYAIINNQLYRGADDDNVATRPTELDMTFYFTKS